MLIAALVLAGLAALLHVYIFTMESITWTSARTRRTFGVATIEEAETTKSLAFNQGFYNLFLAIATALGIVFVVVGQLPIGVTLILTGTGSMLAAAFVLLVSSADHRRAAITQGLFPLLAVVASVIALLL